MVKHPHAPPPKMSITPASFLQQVLEVHQNCDLDNFFKSIAQSSYKR